METNRIRQFCVVYETKNLRKAAEVLNLSHSALSKSLKVLQDQLGLALFRQEGRGIAATDSAIDFYPRAKAFLEAEGRLVTPQTGEDVFRVGTFEVFSTYLLGMRWHRYFSKDLELHELVPGRLEQALLNRKVDVGVTYDPIPTAGIEFVKIGRLQMKIFARAGTFAGVAPERLPFVVPITPVEGSPTGVRGLDGWPENRVRREVRFRVDTMESGLALTRVGQAAIFLPEFVARLHNEVVKSGFQLVARMPPKRMKPIHRDVFLLRRTATAEGPMLRGLAKLIRDECF